MEDSVVISVFVSGGLAAGVAAFTRPTPRWREYALWALCALLALAAPTWPVAKPHFPLIAMGVGEILRSGAPVILITVVVVALMMGRRSRQEIPLMVETDTRPSKNQLRVDVGRANKKQDGLKLLSVSREVQKALENPPSFFMASDQKQWIDKRVDEGLRIRLREACTLARSYGFGHKDLYGYASDRLGGLRNCAAELRMSGRSLLSDAGEDPEAHDPTTDDHSSLRTSQSVES